MRKYAAVKKDPSRVTGPSWQVEAERAASMLNSLSQQTFSVVDG
jgi:hypothetical protein